MFGYVVPYKPELRVKELKQYQSWYCGLCRALGDEYGHIPRLALNYDCTFLALLLEGVEGGVSETGEPRRCALKPFKKKSRMAELTPALSYAAGCNVLLARYKLIDDWHDDKSIPGLLGGWALYGAAKRAQGRYPDVAQHVKDGIDRLSALEKAKSDEIDRVADTFATMLKEIMGGYERISERDSEVLGHVGYYLGRWIYLIDAWEDRQKDKYNPFSAARADKERASFLLYAALNEMEKAYDLLDIKAHKGLIDNIMYQGCRYKTRLILEGLPNESL